MSKAFTRESDDESGMQETSAPRLPLPSGTRNLITQQGAERLRQRLKDLLEQKQDLAEAPGAGSEASRRRLDADIRRLKQTLDSIVVAGIPADRDKVGFGATVNIRHGNGEEETYRIVGMEEAEPEQNAINWMSPLAHALLSRRAGDKVRFRSPAGEEELTILTVRYPEM